MRVVSLCSAWQDTSIDSILTRQVCAKTPKTSGIRYPRDPASRSLESLGSFIFIFSWGLRNLWSCYGNIIVWSWGSWISDRKDSVGSCGSWIFLGQFVKGSCGSWISHNNVVRDPWIGWREVARAGAFRPVSGPAWSDSRQMGFVSRGRQCQFVWHCSDQRRVPS